MKSEQEIRAKIADLIELMSKDKPVLKELEERGTPAAMLEYGLLATQVSFRAGVLAGLYFALGYSDGEIRELLGDSSFTGLHTEDSK